MRTLHVFVAAFALLGAIAAQPLLAQPAPAPAGDAKAQPTFNMGAEWEFTPASKAAIEKGLARLAKMQQDDGSFGATGGYTKHCGITGLCALAFMSEGSVPGRGKYAVNVEKALDFVLANTSDSSGLIANPQEASGGPMYGHGFAALFLSEAYGMTGRADIREKLRLAVRLMVNTQNPAGGWRYMPVPYDADLSVTICQTMALRAARNAGVKVPKKTIDKAIDYVRKSQSPDGGFSYTIGGGGATFPCTAAGVASLYYSGVYTGKEVDRAMQYLVKFKDQLKGNASAMNSFGHFYYGHYYGVQAFFLAGGKYWADWFPLIRDCLIRGQQGDGSWSDGVGQEFATAMALIILQVPNRYLPILER
jgi:prenyltransferase beta subunit